VTGCSVRLFVTGFDYDFHVNLSSYWRQLLDGTELFDLNLWTDLDVSFVGLAWIRSSGSSQKRRRLGHKTTTTSLTDWVHDIRSYCWPCSLCLWASHRSLYLYNSQVFWTGHLSSHTTCSTTPTAVVHCTTATVTCSSHYSSSNRATVKVFVTAWPWPLTFWPSGQCMPSDYHRVHYVPSLVLIAQAAFL